MKTFIQKVLDKHDLSIDESYSAMQNIMSGEVSNSQLAAFLVALKFKGESPEEIAGSAKAMRDKSIRINCDDENVIDVCGTGGDESGTFNISTAAAFVAAGAGVKVAKHGNSSISSKCGSADVLQELGVKIDLSPQQSEEALNKVGIAFLFAPIYHPAIKHAAQVRKELAFKTIFNLLGPLTNPAGTKKQIVGTFHRRAAEIMAKAAKHLDYQNVLFYSTSNQYDEILLRGITDIYEFQQGKEINFFKLTHHNFYKPQAEITALTGGNPKTNADIILNVLKDKKRTHSFNVVAANAALAVQTAGLANNLKESIAIAEDSIVSGRAYEKLLELKKFGEKYT